MNNVFKKKLENLKDNFESNAKNALSGLNNWFDENWTNNGKDMMEKTFWYLNDNFRPDNVINWNVVVVGIKSLDDINCDPTPLIAKDNGQMSVFADYGKLTKPFRCDERWPFNKKNLQCIKIKGKKIVWSVKASVPNFWDSHHYDDYDSVTFPDVIIDLGPHRLPDIWGGG